MMTYPRKRPAREQTRDAFEWLAGWHTTSRNRPRRNTTTNGGQRSTSCLDIAADVVAYHVPADHGFVHSTCAYYDTAESVA